MPPRARPRYQAKKPRYWLIKLTYAKASHVPADALDARARHDPDDRRDEERRRKDKRPADDLPASKGQREPCAFRIADTAGRNRDEQQQIRRAQQTAAVQQAIADHERAAHAGHDPESARRSFVGRARPQLR